MTPTPEQPTPSQLYANAPAPMRMVINEVAKKTLPDGQAPSPDLLNGLASVFTELDTEYNRLCDVLGLPSTHQTSTQALRTAFTIYVEDDDYEPALKPGETLPPGIVDRNWASYFCPHPHQTVLKNKLNITNEPTLTDLDFSLAAERSLNLIATNRLDGQPANHHTLSTIHTELFQDLYPWAGNHRVVNMGKGDTPAFADPHTGEVHWFLTAIHHMTEIVPWPHLDRQAFIRAIAAIFAYLNYAHPFRQGNGRTARIFLRHLAKRSPFALQFARTTPDHWNSASAKSIPTEAHPMPNPAPLLNVFDAITIPKVSVDQPNPQPNSAPPTQRAPSRHSGEPTPQPGPIIFDLEAIWPELTAELTPTQQFVLNECCADMWLDAWVPLPDLPQQLAHILAGRIDPEPFRAQTIAQAQHQAHPTTT